MRKVLMHAVALAVLLMAGIACSQSTTPPSKVTKSTSKATNSIGMEFVLIPAGSFTMGADPNFEDAYPRETPRHRVSISKPFYLGKTEVTQQQWVAVMGSNPSLFKGRSYPVDQVSWNDVQAFIRKLNAKDGTTVYRLPTEAEWEYACRAGTTATYGFGDDAGQLGQFAWFDGNSGGKNAPGRPAQTQRVGPVRHAWKRLGVGPRPVWREVLLVEPHG